MKNLKLLCVLPLFIGQLLMGQAPRLSEKGQISMLTCSAGKEIYATFGHTAFRVQDPVRKIDVVYNYGTFDFNKPNFQLNFAKGKLIYSLSRRSFDRFLFDYELEKRWVKEQLLDLDPLQTQQLFDFFERNYLPENRDYRYDPLFNNCANISAELLKKQFGDAIVFKGSHIEKESTFRQLVREFLPANSWNAFGIELAFGAIVDKNASTMQHMFLPYYAMQQLNNTEINGKPLVKRERNVLDYPEPKIGSHFMTAPFFWFFLLLCFVVAITMLDMKHHGHNVWLDFFLFFISGIVGIVILLLWFATDHVVTQTNLNFLWLFPLNAMAAFYVFKKESLPKWFKPYLYLLLISMALIVLIWVVQFQLLSWLNVPLMLALTIRYVFLLKKVA